MQYLNLYLTAAGVFTLNIPFGFWRASAKKFKTSWFLAIHIPVPAVIILRYATGIGWSFITFPVLIGAFFTGQIIGGLIYRKILAISNKRDIIKLKE